MARDEFFQNVRTAIRFAAPTVDLDNPYTDPKDLARVLRGTASWLTPRSVKGDFNRKISKSYPQPVSRSWRRQSSRSWHWQSRRPRPAR